MSESSSGQSLPPVSRPSLLLYQVQLRKQKATTTAGCRAQLIRKNSRSEVRNTSSKIQPVAADRPEFSCHLLFFFYCPSLPLSSADIRRKRLQGLLKTRLHLLHLLWLFAASSRAGANRVVSGYGNTFWPATGWNGPDFFSFFWRKSE